MSKSKLFGKGPLCLSTTSATLHEWEIQEFDKALKRNKGAISSPPFKIPGLPCAFEVSVQRTKILFPFSGIEDDHHRAMEIEPHGSEFFWGSPLALVSRGTIGPMISNYFSIQLGLAGDNEVRSNELELAGTILVTESGVPEQVRGFIYQFKGHGPKMELHQGSGPGNKHYICKHFQTSKHNFNVKEIHHTKHSDMSGPKQDSSNTILGDKNTILWELKLQP